MPTEREKLFGFFQPPFKRSCFMVYDAKDREVLHTGLLGRRYGVDDEAVAQTVVDALNAYFAPHPESGDGGVKRPPMLLAMDESVGVWDWYIHTTYMDKTLWVRGCYAGLEGKSLLAIDRQLSDAQAVEIYDRERAAGGEG